MGYRSDVRMVIHAPKDFMIVQVAALRLGGHAELHTALDEMSLIASPIDGYAALCLRGDGWKWDTIYPDVQAFEAIWNYFGDLQAQGEESPNLPADDPRRFFEMAFVRVGEDSDDVEERYIGNDAWELISVEHIVSIEGGLADLDAPDLRERLNPPA